MKALGLLSGGLDSTIAVKLIIEQGIDVEAINFVTPFCLCRIGGCGATEAAKTFNIHLKHVSAGTDYLRIVRKPRFGYGKNLNPCVDCRIFMLKKAKKYAKQIGAKFIFTGEVLGQRPMSQHKGALDLIEREAGLEGKILRPLSAKLLPETEAEASKETAVQLPRPACTIRKAWRWTLLPGTCISRIGLTAASAW